MKMDKERSTFYHNKLVSQIPKIYTSLKMQKNVHVTQTFYLLFTRFRNIHHSFNIHNTSISQISFKSM